LDAQGVRLRARAQNTEKFKSGDTVVFTIDEKAFQFLE